jgi:hypothetical protein
MNNYTCRVCGKIEDLDSISDAADEKALMREQGYCFSCAFWARYHERDKTDDNALVVDGTHYVICRERPGGPRGFGGIRFKIEFNDGRMVETTNLWCQGDIPEEWRKLFPDTARFIRE